MFSRGCVNLLGLKRAVFLPFLARIIVFCPRAGASLPCSLFKGFFNIRSPLAPELGCPARFRGLIKVQWYYQVQVRVAQGPVEQRIQGGFLSTTGVVS
jgi:hypothetical protein